nr:DUF1643 domain-containing protein [Thioalkalivibrio sp. ALE19]
MVKKHDAVQVQRGARLSPCRRYRYALWRHWGPSHTADAHRRMAFILLNPSTADETEDDPTIRRCMGYAFDWGFDGVVVLNLFAYRATNPAELKEQDDPVGEDNDWMLRRETENAGCVVAAWGNHGVYQGRGETVANMLTQAGVPMRALKVTGTGQPGHPLYLPRNLEPVPWRKD